MNKTKICKKCKRELPLDDTHFFKNKQLKDGYEGSCKECRGSSFTKRKDRPNVKDGEKFCSVCGNIYPNTLEYFPSDSQRKDGLGYYCKKCTNKNNRKNYNSEYKHNYYIKNKDRILNREKQYRLDNIEKFKEKEKLYYVNNTERILEYQKMYRIKNKESIRQKRKEYYSNNKELINTKTREYYKNNKEKLLFKSKQYYIENKEKISEYCKAYAKSERGKTLRKINENKRRTLKKKALSFLSQKQWQNIVDKFNNSCAYCGSDNVTLTMDHFIPISSGGEFTVSNIVPCCYSCNSSKNKYNFFEWYSKQEFYNKQREEKILKHLNYKDGTQQISIL